MESLKGVAQEVKTALENGDNDFLRVTHEKLSEAGFPQQQRGLLIHQVASLMPMIG